MTLEMDCGCDKLDDAEYARAAPDFQATRLVFWEPLLKFFNKAITIWSLTRRNHMVGYLESCDLPMPRETPYFLSRSSFMRNFGFNIHYCAKTLFWEAHFTKEQKGASCRYLPCCNLGQWGTGLFNNHSRKRQLRHGEPFTICGSCCSFVDDDHDHFEDPKLAIRPAAERLPLRFALVLPEQADARPEWLELLEQHLPTELQQKIVRNAGINKLRELMLRVPHAKTLAEILPFRPAVLDTGINQWDAARKLCSYNYSQVKKMIVRARPPVCIYYLDNPGCREIIRTWNGLLTSDKILDMTLDGLDGIFAEDFLFIIEFSGQSFDPECRHKVQQLSPNLQVLTIHMGKVTRSNATQDWKNLMGTNGPHQACQCPMRDALPRNCKGHLCHANNPQMFELPADVPEVRLHGQGRKITRGNIFKVFSGTHTFNLDADLTGDFWGKLWWMPQVRDDDCNHFVQELSAEEIKTIENIRHLKFRPAMDNDDGNCEMPPFFQLVNLETVTLDQAETAFEDHFLRAYQPYDDILEQNGVQRTEVKADELDQRRGWHLPTLKLLEVLGATISPVWNTPTGWGRLAKKAPHLRQLDMRVYGPMVMRDDILEVILQAYGRTDLQITIIKVSEMIQWFYLLPSFFFFPFKLSKRDLVV